jgi:hypothetical protein
MAKRPAPPLARDEEAARDEAGYGPVPGLARRLSSRGWAFAARVWA